MGVQTSCLTRRLLCYRIIEYTLWPSGPAETCVLCGQVDKVNRNTENNDLE